MNEWSGRLLGAVPIGHACVWVGTEMVTAQEGEHGERRQARVEGGAGQARA